MARIGILPNKNMPELPEVETIKNILNTLIKNKTIKSIDILRKSTIDGDYLEFENSLIGETILDVSRIGKYLIFHLTNDKVFLSHLRMEGKYFLFKENEANTKHARVIFHLENDEKIIYDDSRCFGRMKLSSESKYKLEEEIAKLGPEGIEDISLDYIYNKAKKSTLPIKQFLLDQSVISGLGNIYVDETLFASKVHPLTIAKTIKKNKYQEILANAKKVLLKAIESGGSTIKSYHPGQNIDGNFQTELKAYGKRYEYCPECGSKFKFIRVGGRGTTYCPNCQKELKNKLLIGLTGKIAAGKSTVLKTFKDLGTDVISSDEIVTKLYETKSVINRINKEFNLTFTNVVDKNILRNYLKENPKEISKINSIIHPLVKDEIIKFYENSKNKIVIAEVPLLFESKMESLFDYIIGVDVDEDIQLERLKERNPETYKTLKEINKTNTFDKNKKKIDYIIINNDTTDKFSVDIQSVFSKLTSFLN